MRPLAGMWLVVLGYAFLYTGVTSFAGGSVSFMSSLGLAPPPSAGTSAGDIWSQIGSATGVPGAGGIWGAIGGLIFGNKTSSSTSTTPTPQTAGTTPPPVTTGPAVPGLVI